jgi:hypothetical protein
VPGNDFVSEALGTFVAFSSSRSRRFDPRTRSPSDLTPVPPHDRHRVRGPNAHPARKLAATDVPDQPDTEIFTGPTDTPRGVLP